MVTLELFQSLKRMRQRLTLVLAHGAILAPDWARTPGLGILASPVRQHGSPLDFRETPGSPS
jgi:hypothetical protein